MKISLILVSFIAADLHAAEEAIGHHIKHEHTYVTMEEFALYVLLAVIIVTPLVIWADKRLKPKSQEKSNSRG